MNDHCSSIRQTRRRRRRSRRRRTSTSPLRSKVSSPLRYRRLVVNNNNNNNNNNNTSSSSPLVPLDEDEQSAVILELESDYIKHTQSIGWMFLVVCFMAVILSLYIGYYNYYHHDDYHCSNNKPLTSYDHKSPSLSSLSSSSFVSICNTGIYYWSCICYPLYVALVHVSIGYVAFWKLIVVVNVVVHNNNKEEQGEEEKKENREQDTVAQQFVKGAGWKPNTCLTVLVLVSVLFPVILWLLQLLCWGWRAAFMPTAMLLMAAVGGGGSNLVIYLLFLYMEKDCQKTLQQVQDLNTFRYKLKSV